MKNRTTFYAVEITTAAGPVISRYFNTVRAAKNWQRWCAKRWPSRILLAGAGGAEIR